MTKLKNRFDEKFVKELVEKVPKNVAEKFKLKLDEIVHGGIRIDKKNMNSVYFYCNTDHKDNPDIILKFKFRNFHYIKPDFIYDGIYISYDGINEYRYDKNFKLNAKYLSGISILSSISKKEKLHIMEVLNEWPEINEKLQQTDEFIVSYQIEKNDKPIKGFYVMGSKGEVPMMWNRTIDHVKRITSNFDMNKCKWMCKAKIENKEIVKMNTFYMRVVDETKPYFPDPNTINKSNDKQNTNDDG